MSKDEMDEMDKDAFDLLVKNPHRKDRRNRRDRTYRTDGTYKKMGR